MGDMILCGPPAVFPAGLPPHRPGAGLRIDLAVAAADRQALGRTVADGRAVAAEKALEWGLAVSPCP